MSISSAQARDPLTSASASEPAGPLRVSTVRLWTGSECVSSSAAPVAKAAETAAMRSRSRPSEKLGTARSTGPLDEKRAVADHGLGVDCEVGIRDDAVEMDRDLNRAPDPRRGPEGNVHRAEDLLVLQQLAAQDRLLVRADAE